MGKVIKLETPRKSAPVKTRTARSGVKKRPARSKTALVLGGGGFTGGVYEIGALRALDLLSDDISVNDFDIYVGTSAGAFVSALVANGVTPEEMMRAVVEEEFSELPPLDMGKLISPNLGGYISHAAKLPLHVLNTARGLAKDWRSFSVMDLFLGLSESLPPGLYKGDGTERYVRAVADTPGRTNDFRELGCELYLTATDLDTAERVVLGRDEWADLPISMAVEASTALPMVYRPVELRGHEFVDGGVISTTNVDVAVEAGAKLIVVVNPLVPFLSDYSPHSTTYFGTTERRISEMGFAKVGYQVFRLLAHNRLHEAVKQWEEKYPGVDIVLIEPEQDDELMFGTNVMSYKERVAIAKHGFSTVTQKLATDYVRFQTLAEKHGLSISSNRLQKVVEHFETDAERTQAWKRILANTKGALLRQAGV